MPGRILIVDDEADILAVVGARLQAAGYETATAGNGLEGLSLARDWQPDLVILDLMLPGIDGFSVCAMLKRDQRLARIPVLILTARVQAGDKKTSADLGADGYLTKPFKTEELLGRIAELLGHSAPDHERIPAAQAAS